MADLLNIPHAFDKKLPKPDWIRVKAPIYRSFQGIRHGA